MPELLIEIFSEEIPARMQADAAKHLAGQLEGLPGADAGKIETHHTAQRLVGVVADLPVRQPDTTEERRGPRVGAPDKAISGFLGSVGFDSIDQCEVRETKKGEFYFAVIKQDGRDTADVVGEWLPEVIYGFPWPKSMRWGNTAVRWVRPLHHVLCVFDGKAVPGSVGLAGTGGDEAISLPFTSTTRGHRFMAPDPIEVAGFAGYESSLREAKVMLRADERSRTIVDAAHRLAEADGFAFKENARLLDEVVGLVEWPETLIGRIDDQFMDIPDEVLVSSMTGHQKYFPLYESDGGLAPRFIVVSNMVAPDGGVAIRAGNERVLRARLHDAKFFWDQDRQTPLAERQLDKVIFHAKLGSVADRVARLRVLAQVIAGQVPNAAPELVDRAAELCKTDLVTDMVGEFPELQGVMGRYYALHDGEDPAVAEAIAEHYAPAGRDDAPPTKPVSICVALAEKIDTLVGLFAIGEKPTGSKDPFALRRAALGVIRTVLDNGVRVPLRVVFQDAISAYGARIEVADPTALIDELLGFLADRLKVHFRQSGLRHDLVSAAFAVADEDDLVRLNARVEALSVFLESDDGANLLTAYRRATNIVNIEERKDGASYDALADGGLLAAAEEKSLHAALETVSGQIDSRLADEDFNEAMAALATLRAPVDGFFDSVTVNCDDPALRRNRLQLLSQIRRSLTSVADLSLVEG